MSILASKSDKNPISCGKKERNLMEADKNPNVYDVHWNQALACSLSCQRPLIWARTHDEAETRSEVSSRASVKPKHRPRGVGREESWFLREKDFQAKTWLFSISHPLWTVWVNGAADCDWLVRWSSLIIWSAGRWVGGWCIRGCSSTSPPSPPSSSPSTRWPSSSTWLWTTELPAIVAGLLFGELLDEQV